MKRLKFSVTFTALILVLSLLIAAPACASAAYVETTGSVNIRSGPGGGYSKVSTASEGSYLTYLGATRYDYRDIAWYKVECKYGKGWVSSMYSKLVNHPSPKPVTRYVEITSSVNIRSGPSLYYDIVSYGSVGEYFDYLNSTKYDSRDVAWYKIRCSNGIGWVSSTYSYLVDDEYEEYVETTASTNIRRGPGLDYRIITSVEEGETFVYDGKTTYDDRDIAWYRIDYEGTAAWVSSMYTVLY